MSNPAVAKWLEEIAAAKAKAQAKEQQQQQQQKRQELTNAPIDGLSQQTQPQPTQLLTSIAPQYGIITSYNLRTRKKQLRLILPPEPHKPGPGECCGNDCEPCVNTIYWEDMAAHRERCRKMQLQYEDECRALLEASEGSGVESRSTVGDGVRKVEVEDAREKEGEDDDGKGLSIRSYRPFKVLQKRYLSENTLVVVCDLPYSPKKMDNPRATNSRAKANVVPTMFHLLIRFQRPDGQYLTKAFTPVDMSRLHTTSKSVSESRSHGGDDVLGVGVGGQEFEDRMAFLVKLYPSPHSTSEMFRDLEVYAESDGDGGGVGYDSNNNNNINNNNRKGVLFLRGPIQTGRDRLKNQQQQQQQQQQLGNNLSPTAGGTRRKPKKRIVMIAAGSGITPMYQVLRALHDQQQKHQHSLGAVPVQEEGGDGEFWEADEVDLVYCNRTTDDIWLRQELQSIGVSHGQEEGGGKEDISEMAAGLSLVKRTAVRLQHVLSSSSSVDQTSIQGRGENHQFHTGRITLDLLRNTLQQQDQSSIGRQEDKEEEQLQILICGPPLFNKDVSAMLTLLEYHDSDTCEIHILE